MKPNSLLECKKIAAELEKALNIGLKITKKIFYRGGPSLNPITFINMENWKKKVKKKRRRQNLLMSTQVSFTNVKKSQRKTRKR